MEPGRAVPTTAFSATLEELTSSADGGQARLLCRVYRSAHGRHRSDFLVVGRPEEAPSVAWLFDAETRLMLLLDRTTEKVLQRTAFERPRSGFWGWNGPGPFTPFPFPHEGLPRREELGTRVLEGFVTRGSLTVYTDGWHECWSAPELKEAPLLERWRVASGHERTAQLFAVRLGEPDPALFAALDAG